MDAKLPGPLYGLPAIDTNYRLSHTRTTGYLRSKATLRRERVQFELELLSQKALWNADLPIHSLPAEILLQIFEQLTRPQLPGKLPSEWLVPDERPRRPWARLMQVCRHWCALIRNGAFFWKEVVVTKHTRWLDLALSRLGRAPICIFLAPDCNLELVLSMLSEHTDHIERLIFGRALCDVDIPGVESFLSRSFPVLRGLTISMDEPADPAHPVGGSCCGLEWLQLDSTSLPWTKSLLTHLEVLSLTDCCLSTPALSISDFLNVLEHGQHLRYLYLTDFLSIALDPQTFAPHGRLVTLPGLQHLECNDMQVNVAHLMTHLHTPTIAQIELVGDCNRNVPSTAHASLLPRDLDTRFPILQTITRASLDVYEYKNRLRVCHPSGTSFILGLSNLDTVDWGWSLWLERGLSQLPTLLGPALTELEIRGALDISQVTWDRVFDAFPALQRVIVHELYHHVLPLAMLRSLATAPTLSVPHGAEYTNVGQGRIARVRCPALKHLQIDGWDWSRRASRQMLKCLRVRAAHGASRLEYLGTNAEEGMVPLPVLEKFRAQFLRVVDKFVMDG